MKDNGLRGIVFRKNVSKFSAWQVGGSGFCSGSLHCAVYGCRLGRHGVLKTKD